MTVTKVCNKCNIDQPVSCFSKDRTRNDGYSFWCKLCFKSYRTKWIQTASSEKLAKVKQDVIKWNRLHPERTQELGRKWRLDNQEYKHNCDKTWRMQNVEHMRAYRKSNAGKINARNAKRRATKIKATPMWFEHKKVNMVYEKAALWSTLTGTQLEVDHIVPLISKTVCGLHCWHNLQIIDKTTNASKNNNYITDW